MHYGDSRMNFPETNRAGTASELPLTGQHSSQAAPRLDSFLRLPEVMRITGRSRATIYRAMENGTFPKKIQLGENTVAWLESEIAAWIAERTATRAA